LNKPLHVAIVVQDRASVDAFYKAAIAAGGRDNGAPGIRAHYHPTTAPSCSIPTAIEAVCQRRVSGSNSPGYGHRDRLLSLQQQGSETWPATTHKM
jgi:hypothetical protein